jgi:arsenate reductase (thioredoxin)
MAEAFLNDLGKGKYFAESAGLVAGKLNPIAVDSMKELGYDISRNKTKSVFDFYKQGKLYSYVITVCDAGSSEQCPIFPGKTRNLHWDFPDPSGFLGSYEEKLEKTGRVRDQIKEKIIDFIKHY